MEGGLEQRSAAADLAPRMARRALGTEPKALNGAGIIEHNIQSRGSGVMKTEPAPYPQRQEQQSPTPLDDIALLLQNLTYGEMIELCQAMWKIRSEGELTEANLPALLHRWATSHLAATQS